VRPLLGAVDVPPGDLSASALPLSGWVLDPNASGSSGVDGVSVYLGAPADNGPLLGQAQLGQARPDVASHFANADWGSAGFAMDVPLSSLPAGLTTLTVAAHSPEHGTWLSSVQVVVPDLPPAVVAAPAPEAPRPAAEVTPQRLQVDSPKAGSTIGRTALVQGIAFDQAVDHVDVFLEPDRDHGGRLVGTGPARQASRFKITLNGVPPGAHTLYVHAYAGSRESVVSFAVDGGD